LRTRVSIKDIAKKAGVSHSTVSRALRDSPLVSQETKERIRRLAEEMGYSPSAVARGLVTQRTHTIGLVVTSIADPFVSRITDGIEDVALNAGYSVFLCNSHADPERELAVVRTFHERRVDGVIVTASRVGSLYSSLLEELGVPVVLINNQRPGRYVYSVSTDNRDGARKAVDYLIKLGHRRIAYIGSQSRLYAHGERLAGYREALTAHGLSPDPRYIVADMEADDINRGRRAARDLLSLSPPPTAIFCFNDMTAIGVLVACREMGCRVPEDLSVVGFDDIAMAAFTCPPLTTVRQQCYELGREAMNMMLKLLNNQEASDLVLPAELVMRESCRALVEL